MVMSLAPWEDRDRSQQEILNDVTSLVQDVPGVRAFAFQPNSLGIRGAGSGLQFAIVGNSYADLNAAAEAVVAEFEQDCRFRQPRLSQETTQPQLSVRIDRTRKLPVTALIGPRHQHHRLVGSDPGHGRQPRNRLGIHRRPLL